jgi:peptidoglycan/xylan/chitin deacetylase (PgdA/CDA1 family)
MMLRGLIKTSAACALSWTGVNRLLSSLPGFEHLLVIGYHRVVQDFSAHTVNSIPAMLISTDMLERQLDWIGRRFQFISVDELGAKLVNGERCDKPTAVITFDDGYRDVYQNAYPLLKRKGIPATVFVVTGHMGATRPFIYDRLYLLLSRAFCAWHSAADDLIRLLLGLGIYQPTVDLIRRAGGNPHKSLTALLSTLGQADLYRIIEALEEKVEIHASLLQEFTPMTWEMLTDLHRNGVTIGSHTKTHIVMTNEGPDRIEAELRGSRQELERRLGAPVKHFAYPDGKFNMAAVTAVAAAGYHFGYTTCRHRDPIHPLLTIPRILLWENAPLDALGSFSSAVMSTLVNHLFDFANPCRQDHRQLYTQAACRSVAEPRQPSRAQQG